MGRTGKESENPVNIYEKLQAVRIELAAQGIKKGKKNTYSNYDYYELADFLPQVMKLCQEHKLMPALSYTPDMAVLTIYDCEKPDAKIEFTTPMSTAKLKACHEVQNLGAVMTYERRYLYITAFEIVEADLLEANTGKPNMSPVENTRSSDIGTGYPGKMNGFSWDHTKNPLNELTRLWTYANWNTAAIPEYVNQRAGQMNVPVNNTVYETIIRENIHYLNEEKAKGNTLYVGKIFGDNIPF